MSLITVEKLSVSFDGRNIFKDLSFEVNEGDYLCILGENGSGKTTLMRCLIGNDVRHSGKINYNGFKKNNIGWLPQRTDAKRDFPASVQEIVMSGFSGKGFFGLRYTAQNRKTAQKNMELLEISALKNRFFRDLSGGQQQRVLLCRALCAADKILLLDEPVTGLDSISQNEFYRILRKLHDNGMTVIMISHDVVRSVAEATHILHISDYGYFFGTTQNYRLTDNFKNNGGN